MVEAAFSMCVYLFLVMGLLEGALMAYSIGVLAHAVHDGARQAALTSTTSVSVIQTRVAGTASEMTVSLQPSDVTLETKTSSGVTKAYGARQTGDRVRVSATYSYRPLTAFILASTLPLSRATEIMVE
jgi:TadE-like protein